MLEGICAKFEIFSFLSPNRDHDDERRQAANAAKFSYSSILSSSSTSENLSGWSYKVKFEGTADLFLKLAHHCAKHNVIMTVPCGLRDERLDARFYLQGNKEGQEYRAKICRVND